MSYRKDLEGLLRGEKTDHVCWFGDLSYYYFALEKSGRLEEKYKGVEGEVRFYQDLGVGIYLYAPNVFSVEWREGYSITDTNDGEAIRTVFSTPKGELNACQKYLSANFSYAYTKHCVESIEDLYLCTELMENTIYKENFAPFVERDALYGEGGMAFALAPISVSPVQSLLTRWAGVEKTVELVMDYPDEFAECVSRIEQAQLPVFEILARSPAKVVVFPDNISSEVAGFFFRDYNLPYYQRLNKILHDAGKLTAIHIDGTLKPCLSMLREAGFDIAEAVTPAPVGDVPLSELRRIAGEDIIIWGGLPGALFTPQFTQQQFEDHVREFLRIKDDRFVLGVADQVPPDGIWERVRSVREMISG